MRSSIAAAPLAVLLVTAPASAAATDGRYTAEIRRTEGGMPHIKARDFGSLGFGYAYAYAEDQACRFADIVATVNAQRSRYFGPDASFGDLGGQTSNRASDFFYQRIKDSRVVERLRHRQEGGLVRVLATAGADRREQPPVLVPGDRDAVPDLADDQAVGRGDDAGQRGRERP